MAIALRSSRAARGGDGWPTSKRGWRQWQDRAQRLENRELAHRMYDLAAALNQRRGPGDDPLWVLELVRGDARRALDYLGGRIRSQPLPLPSAPRAAYHLAIELLHELALGYEQALSGTGVSRRGRALAAERALSLHGERMLRTHQTYTALDTGFWRRVNGTYRTAEQLGVAERRVDDPELRFTPRRRQSPQGMFKRLLLFALAGTQGFRRGEAARLNRALETWKDMARLTAARREPESSIPRFAVDLASAHGPRLLGSDDRAASVRVLEVADLVVEVEQLRERRGPADKALPAEDEVGPTALARLIDSWQPANYTRSPRARRGSEVDAEATLPVIHARIVLDNRPREADRGQAASGRDAPTAAVAQDPPDWSIEEIEAAESTLGRHPDEVRPGVNWTEIPLGRDRSAGEEEARVLEAGEPPTDTPDGAPRWLLRDISASGLRLLWDGEGSCRVSVGEPVALRIGRGAEHSRWCVGVVRRMRFVDERRFEIGVEVLARNAIPGRVRSAPANPNSTRFRDSETTTPALLLPGNRKRGRRTTLLIPAHMHRTGDLLEVDLQERTTRIALGDLRKDTGIVSQFDIAPPPARGRRAPSDARFVAAR